MFYCPKVFPAKADCEAYLRERGFAPWPDNPDSEPDYWIRRVGAVTSRANIGQCKTGQYLITTT